MGGTGAVLLPVPPDALLYQSRLVPVAVRAVAATPWQRFTGLTPGAGGTGFTVTGTCRVSVVGQSPVPVDVTVYTVLTAGVAVILAPVVALSPAAGLQA